MFKKKLSTRFGLIFYEDNIIIPKTLRTTIITLLHKGHPAINKMNLAAKGVWWPRLTEQIQKKCEDCVPCRASGKNIKPNIPHSEINFLPELQEPNEEIQLDFIGPIRFNHKPFYILLAMDRYSKWPSACICKRTDGTTVINFMNQLTMVHGIPKTIRTDKGTAFTGKKFRNYCRSKNIKLIYGTPNLHTPTGLVERGVRSLKESMLTNLKDNKSMNESIDLALEVMRMTPHTRLKKSAFELHFGRKPNTELSNLLGTNPNANILANPETLQIYSFSNKGQMADILPMRSTKRSAKDNVSKTYPFKFLERNPNAKSFDSKYKENVQTAINGTDHTITTQDNRIIHRKLISNPLKNCLQDNSKRGKGPRNKDGKFRKQNTESTENVEEQEDEQAALDRDTEEISEDKEKTPEKQTKRDAGTASIPLNTEQELSPGPKTPGIGRGRNPLIRRRPKFDINWLDEPCSSRSNFTRPDILTTDDWERIMSYTDNNGSMNLSNLLQNLEINGGEENREIKNETEITPENEQVNTPITPEFETRVMGIPERRSKRLTKTNPIVRFNNPVIMNDYRKRSEPKQKEATSENRT